ncbi:MAG TPA: sigma-70 family RNA polymerase sigma factor [Cyclobacteriaceae bacterium]|nr:sigma-70 family RNA polymerase sigma factor [Cyclobacteriaceae bacterium]
MTDIELVELYRKSGGMEVLGALFQRYTAMLFGVCMKYLKDREASKDAVMQLFEKLTTALHEYEITHFKSWLYVTARNHCLMEIRSRKGKNFEDIETAVMESDGQMHPEDSLELETNLGKLEKCIEELIQEQKHCVQLFYLQQRCYQEISDLTGYNYNQVKSYIQNGKRNLKICIERNG